VYPSIPEEIDAVPKHVGCRERTERGHTLKSSGEMQKAQRANHTPPEAGPRMDSIDWESPKTLPKLCVLETSPSTQE